MTMTVLERHAVTEPAVERLLVEQVATLLARGESTLLDLREPAERARQGAIPGAVHAPWGQLEFWEELTEAYYRAKSDANARVILLCDADGRSARAARTLQHMGYTHLALLVGGFEAWRAAGQSVCAA